MSHELSLGIAVLAGSASFFSPCVLPLLPTYLGYLAGVTAGNFSGQPAVARKVLLLNALAFIFGFATVFVGLGLSASALGRLLLQYQHILRQAGGLLVILFGLHMAGILNIPLLLREKKAGFKPGKAGLFNSLLLGMAFSFGWTPCVGPVLGTILVMASNSASLTTGALLLAAYSLGLALPFLAAAFFVDAVIKFTAKWSRFFPLVNTLTGVLLIVVGLLLFTGYLNMLPGITGI